MSDPQKPGEMFQVKENECVGFDSRWKVTKVSIETDVQTTESSSTDNETNTAKTAELETQTDEPAMKTADYDETKLAEWLAKIYPQVTKELNDNAKMRAFKNYNPFSGDSADARTKLVKSVDVGSNAKDKGLPISAVAWSCTGNTLAIGCMDEHDTWCHHNGVVRCYSFDRNDEISDMPQKILKCQGCVTSLRFHSILPAICAGGTYTGDIVIWNTQNDDNDSVLINVSGHEQALTQISWVHDVDAANTLLLATSSLDGFLNLWNFNSAAVTLNIKEKHKIRAPIFGKVKRKTATPTHIAKKADRGIISFDFSNFMHDTFVVAAEGGIVAQCSLLCRQPLKGSTDACPIVDSVRRYHTPHEGEITTIALSPYRREMFATNGSEGEIHIFILEQEEPAQVIFIESALQCISWVPYAEKLLAGCGLRGRVEIFDIVKKKVVENSMDKELVDVKISTQMDINFKRMNTVAIGTKTGDFQLWTVPWNALEKI